MGIHWTSLTERFPDEEQCLASFIAWQAAEVISNVKPANLVNIFDRELACGRNIHALWQKYKATVFAAGEIRALELKQKNNSLLILIYHQEALAKVLQKHVVKATLGKLGYRYDNSIEALAQLKERMQGADFPHEVGFFLGYPIKDVLGFMGLCNLPHVGNGPWKMYGKREASMATWKEHLAARKSVLDTLCSNVNPLFLLQKNPPVSNVRNSPQLNHNSPESCFLSAMG